MALESQIGNSSDTENVQQERDSNKLETSEKTDTCSTTELKNGSGKTIEAVVGGDDVREKAETESSEKNGSGEDQDENALHEEQQDDATCIREVEFSVKIQPPTGEPIDMQVSSLELVQELQQMLMDRDETCHRTCFSLQFQNQTLDSFAEFKSIEGLKEGSVIKVQEEAYTVREARLHVRHVRDLLKSLSSVDSFNGVDGASLSSLTAITQGDLVESRRSTLESVDCTPPDYIMPRARDRPLLYLHPKEAKVAQCIKVLTMSGWNPPPGPRKMRGDLLYLHVVSCEGKRFNVTASTLGFYVNQSTEDVFNPKPDSPCFLNHSLIDLLNCISPTFKRNFGYLLKKRTLKHPLERLPTPFQVHTWMSPAIEHTIDSIRAEDAFSSKLGYEEHLPGQTRDWNEELQTTRELSRKTLPERLLRERAVFKIHSDFVAAATRGAMVVIDGNVMAINPGDDHKMQMFIWNNIFFSLGFDVRDHYKEVGGDAAAHVAPRNDLQGVKVYNSVDVEGMYTLGTVIVDYRGYRVTAQSIIPGILERDQEQSVVYGSIDFGKTVVTNEKYMELLGKAAQPLRNLPHTVYNEKDEEIELCSSLECKGIIGNDGRHYILDLLRTFPPDVNFLDLDGCELSKEVKDLGYPIKHPHKLPCLRQELLDAFIEYRYMAYLRHAALSMQQLKAKKQEAIKLEEENKEDGKEKNIEDEEMKKMVENVSENLAKKKKVENTEVIRNAAISVGSLSETDFDIRFNPDVYSPGIRHVDPSGEKLKKERQVVKDAAEFLVTSQLPGLVQELCDHATAPTDGSSLVELMHAKGVNVRYLGKLAGMLSKRPDMHYLCGIAVAELLTRAAKHLFITYLQSAEPMSLSVAVAHFLNCFLSSNPSPHVSARNEELLSKRRRKKHQFSNTNSSEWALLNPKSLWSNIKEEIKSYYSYNLETEGIDRTAEHYGIQKVSLLRSVCIKCGIQVLLRDYNFDHKSQDTFKEDDIINIYPIVKHINPRATDAFNVYNAGKTKVSKGLLKEGYSLISEALTLLNNVYGVMHPEIVQCLHMVSRLNYVMGDYTEAMFNQQKTVLMSERVNGVDHPVTITEYIHLALYCFANQQISTSLKLLYRARYLLLLVTGECHPQVALVDSNIGLILHAVSQYSLSLLFLEKAVENNIKFYGEYSLKVALSYHLVARTQSCMGDFRAALKNEKETFSIYKAQLGTEHDKTKEADECLRHLTQQAVVMAKKMNYGNAARPNGLLPIQIQPPSLASVLDLLNIINGILYVHITPQEIERVRHELEKGQFKVEEVKVPLEESSGSSSTAQADDNNDDEEEEMKKESTNGADDSDGSASR